MYDTIYPPEGRMRPEFCRNLEKQYQALVDAAAEVTKRHGDWKVKWGDVHRLQRHANVADFIAIPFNDKKPSLPCAGVPEAWAPSSLNTTRRASTFPSSVKPTSTMRLPHHLYRRLRVLQRWHPREKLDQLRHLGG